MPELIFEILNVDLHIVKYPPSKSDAHLTAVRERQQPSRGLPPRAMPSGVKVLAL